MKIKGFEDLAGLPSGHVTIPRPGGKEITLCIRALPLGVDEDAERISPSPVPGWAYSTNSKGLILRDKKGEPVRREDRGATFQAEENKASGYQMLYYVWLALSGGGDVEFEAKPGASGVDKTFLDEIKGELIRWGFTQGDIGLLVNRVLTLSNIGEKEIDAASLSFLEQTGAGIP